MNRKNDLTFKCRSLPAVWKSLALILILLLPSLSLNAAGPDSAVAPELPTFWLIPHTHWEGAVFKTREEYLEMGLPHLLTAVRLLKEHPNYRFTLDQVEYFRAFLERYPEEADAFRKFVAEGRLQIVCGLNVMPDDNMPSGESFIRQMLAIATTPAIDRLSLLLVLPWCRGPKQNAFGISLAGFGRHANPGILAAVFLWASLRAAEGPSRVQQIHG